jgi:hypothetical protein
VKYWGSHFWLVILEKVIEEGEMFLMNISWFYFESLFAPKFVVKLPLPFLRLSTCYTQKVKLVFVALATICRAFWDSNSLFCRMQNVRVLCEHEDEGWRMQWRRDAAAGAEVS